jgi:hypothetical protein
MSLPAGELREAFARQARKAGMPPVSMLACKGGRRTTVGGNLPSLPGGLPGGLPSSLPNLPSSLPSASSLASGGLGSGGSLPSSIPGSSLLPNPIPGNIKSQVAQGQSLFQAAQNVAAGTPGSIATLLQGAATVATSNMSAGLPKTLIMDAAGIAAGFAMGGPVGGAVAIASTAIGFVTSLFSGSGQVTWEGFETQPSDASVRNWTLIQNYMANLTGSSESGYPPGWYLGFYMAMTAAPYTLEDLTDLFLLKTGTFHPKTGDPIAINYLGELANGTLSNLTITTRYNGDEAVPKFLHDVPWKDPCGWQWTPATGVPQSAYPKPTDSFFKALMMTEKHPYAFEGIWGSDFNTIPLAYLWGDPTGQGLPTGSLAQGINGVTTPGLPPPSTLPACDPQFPNVPCQKTSPPFSQGIASVLSQTLADISDKPGMTRKSIVLRAMKLAPRNLWFDPTLYQLGAIVDNSNQFTALVNLDVLNALTTICVMLAVGAHPRAITTELLVQQANVFENGGSERGEQNLTSTYRRFMDEWLNISQGYAPDTHVPVLGQMSSDAPPEAHATHAKNMATLTQWVQHYLG